MGIIASSLSRRDAAVKPIPRRDRGTTEEYEVMFFEEERLGPAALEARGDRFMSIGRHRRGWSPDISRLFEEAATSYVLAEKCRLYFWSSFSMLYQSLLII
jgi:hypothetical protein